MTAILNKSLQGSYSILQTIEREIAQSPISSKKYLNLSKKLDHELEALQTLEKTSNLFVKTQTDSLKEKVVTLYGDLEDGRIEGEVSQIHQESRSLKKGRISLKAVKQLEAHINDLEKNHLTSIPHRRVIADAKHALLEAKAKLEGKPVTNHIDWLAKQTPVRFVEEIELLPGEVEELFDIAKAVYNGDARQAKKRYLSLPEDHKLRFHKHMQNLMAKPFDDSLETMQALIATVNELVDNGEGYPSRPEIDQLFLGLSQLSTEEKMGNTQSVDPFRALTGRIISPSFRQSI